MQTPSLIVQYENFRSSMVSGINNLEIDEAQKRIFMVALQSFYLDMLLQIPNNSDSTAIQLSSAAKIN